MRRSQLGAGMQRREFGRLVGAAATMWTLGARAENTNKSPRRIVFFPDFSQVTLDFWRADMRVLGWIEGQDYIVLPSGIEVGRSTTSEIAQRIVADKPDLIFVATTAYAL